MWTSTAHWQASDRHEERLLSADIPCLHEHIPTLFEINDSSKQLELIHGSSGGSAEPFNAWQVPCRP